MKSSLRLGQVTQLGFGSILLLMMTVGGISKLATNRLVDSVGWVSHTYEVKAQLASLEKDLVDAETGQRGFLYTGQDIFLEPYNNSKNRISEHFSELKALVKDNPTQLKRLTQVNPVVQSKMDELAETIALKQSGKDAAVRELVLSGKGKQLMDEIRGQLAEMADTEDTLLEQRRLDARQAEQLSTWVSVGGMGTAIALGVVVLVFIARRVISPINQVAAILATSSTEIAAAVEQQERTTTQQASSVHETTTTMDELNASSRQSAEQAEAAASGAQQVLSLAASGNQAVEQTLEGMAELKLKVSAIADQILRLSEQTGQIGTISGLVSDLANQTNMLALNAAVEAARAGEQGRGFAVVAGEIRKLADQSRKSAERINGLVGDIQSTINSTVMVTDEGIKTVEAGVKTAQGTATAFASVAEAINHIAVSSQQISLTAKQQAIAIQQVVDAMNLLNEGAVQTASGVRQTKIGTQKLNEAALNLKAVV